MPETPPLRPDDPTVVGPYRLTGRLGMGGQGVVYLGSGPDGIPVAVKLLREELASDPRVRDRFMKEIAAARRVDPFCIAQVLDASVEGSRPYVVTEYVEGPSLQQAGPRQGRAAIQRLAVATASALAAIHQAGIVHRDFKPSNVLLGQDGPRVIDFGIARASEAPLTVTSGIIGTPAYMAPEQFNGEEVGPPADVFAWGVVMVYAATGKPAFGADTLPAIMKRVLSDEPDLTTLHEPLRATVAACLAKEPSQRPTMEAVLLRLLGSESPAATAPQAVQAPQPPAAPFPSPIPAPPAPHLMPGPPGAPVMPGPLLPGQPRQQGSGKKPALILGVGAAGALIAATVAGILLWTQLGGDPGDKDSAGREAAELSGNKRGQPGALGNPAPGNGKTPGSQSGKPSPGASSKSPRPGDSRSPSPTKSPKPGGDDPTPKKPPSGGSAGSARIAYLRSETVSIHWDRKRGCFEDGVVDISYGFNGYGTSSPRFEYQTILDGHTRGSYSRTGNPNSLYLGTTISASSGTHRFTLSLRSPSSEQRSVTARVC